MKYRMVFCFVLIISWQPCASQVSDTLFLYFDNAAYHLKENQKKQLDSLVVAVKKNKAAEIKIYGFTDQTGKLSDNKDLSLKRAKSVRGYLFSDKHKLSSGLLTGFRGAGPLVATNATQAELQQARHRRVEVIVQYAGKATNFSNLNAGENITLENLDFIPGRHVITPESQPAMDHLLLVMQQNPTLKIEIQGHICCQTGTDGFDTDTKKYELSANRAKFVYNYLVKNGIEANRLTYRGFGRKRPKVNPEITEEDRQKNRRVEIRILSR